MIHHLHGVLGAFFCAAGNSIGGKKNSRVFSWENVLEQLALTGVKKTSSTTRDSKNSRRGSNLQEIFLSI
jgi:hypothetical protein